MDPDLVIWFSCRYLHSLILLAHVRRIVKIGLIPGRNKTRKDDPGRGQLRVPFVVLIEFGAFILGKDPQRARFVSYLCSWFAFVPPFVIESE